MLTTASRAPLDNYTPMPVREEDNLATFGRSVSRRWVTAAFIFGAMMSVTVVIAFLFPKTYTTTAEIMSPPPARATNSDTSLPVVQSLFADSGVPTVETYAAMAQRYTVVQSVINDLHLPISAKDFVEQKLLISPLTNTNVVKISVAWNDPHTAAKAANAVARAYIEQDRQAQAAKAQFAIAQIGATLPHAQSNVDRAEAKLTRFQTAHGIADVGAQTTAVVAQLSAVETKIGELSGDRRDAQAQLSDINQQLTGTGARIEGERNVANSEVAQQLRIAYGKSVADLAAARGQFTARYPAVVALQNQTDALRRQLAALPTSSISSMTIPNPLDQHLRDRASTIAGQLTGDASQIDELKDQRAKLSARLRTLPKDASTLAALQREAKSAETVLDALQNRYYQSLVAKTVAASDVTLVDPARAENAERTPKTLLTLLAGLLVSLAGALSTVFLLDRLDRSIRDGRDASHDLPVPLLASIGTVRNAGSLAKASGQEIIAMVDSLRHNGGEPLRSLSFVSSKHGEGKSTIALNTATRLAEQRSVLLVDGDFRHPSLHRSFDLPASPGLADVLAGKARLTDLTIPTGVKGLDLLPAGDDTSATSRSLNVERLKAIIKGGNSKYDMIVIDTAATSGAPESYDIAAATDGTIMVVSEGSTDRELAQKTYAKITDVWGGHVVGTVLNRAKHVRKFDPSFTRPDEDITFALAGGPPIATDRKG